MTPISAQGQNWDAVVAAAKQEGKLLIYNGTNFPVVRKIANEMQKTYGITVDVLDGRATEIRERIRIEQSTNRTVASLSYSGFTTLFTQSQEGAFQDAGVLPNAKGVAPELAAKDPIVLGSVGLFILMYNTNLVKGEDAPKSWQDLTDPKWQGKILADDFRAAGAGNVWFEATYNAFGRAFHEKMALQKPVFSRNFPGKRASRRARRISALHAIQCFRVRVAARAADQGDRAGGGCALRSIWLGDAPRRAASERRARVPEFPAERELGRRCLRRRAFGRRSRAMSRRHRRKWRRCLPENCSVRPRRAVSMR